MFARVTKDRFGEMTMLLSLQHPNIIKMMQHFTIDDTDVLILEHCSAGNLEDLVRTTKQFMLNVRENLLVIILSKNVR